MDMKRIPADTWLAIFEEVLEEGQRSREGGRGVTVLLRVCKAWKKAVEPLVFRHILLTSTSSLGELTMLLLSVPPRAPNPGKWTRSLTIRLPVPHSRLAQIPTLILSMPNLENYSISGTWVTCAELSLLSHQYLATLSTFSASVSPDFRSDYGPNSAVRFSLYDTLHTLRDFWSLRNLSLDISSHDERILMMDPNAFPIKFPSVETFEYASQARGAIASIGWCRFPVLKTFVIQASSTQDMNDLKTLKSFFSSHPLITVVKMSLPLAWLETLFREQLVPAPTIELLDAKANNIPSVTLLPTTLHKLTLHVGIGLRPLCGFLDELVGTSSPHLSQLHIVLRKDGPVNQQKRFTWKCGTLSDALATLVGTLVSYAIQLRAHRIDVIDENGDAL